MLVHQERKNLLHKNSNHQQHVHHRQPFQEGKILTLYKFARKHCLQNRNIKVKFVSYLKE